jgi:AcrR family transcriptional regulator
MPAPPKKAKRTYNSPLRAKKARATRRRIRGAATKLFLSDGYDATSMARVAKEAGVAEKTVYLVFPSKATLLSEIITVAVRGDDEKTPLQDRRNWAEMLASPDSEIVGRFASAYAALLDRSAPVVAIGEAAALADAELVPMRDRGHDGQRSGCRDFASELKRRGMLDGGVAAATDALFALTSEDVYRRLVHEQGWSRRRFSRWLERTIRLTLVVG